MKDWYKNAVIYQIYPQSFKDSNNDGIGDILGIIEKLDYLKYLGVDAIWISPMYESPNYDNGYDVKDYYKLQSCYGSDDDFDLLVAEAHKRDIKIIMDLIINHTSHEHFWFVESKKNKTNPKSDWYIWKDPKPDGSEPTNWRALFGGSTWTYCQNRNQYYFHTFSPYQPDLNWKSKEMKKELFKMVNWWIKRGVDGFRLDAINFIGKDNYTDGISPDGKYVDPYPFIANKPLVYDYLKELKEHCFGPNDSMTVGEASSANVDNAIKFAEQLDMIFQFEHIALDAHPTIPWKSQNIDIVKLKEILNKWQTQLYGRAWNAIFWENHDQPRIVTRLGCENKFREKSAKMLSTCIYFMQGTPFVYQGQELGMVNTRFDKINEIRDIEIKNAFKYHVDSGDCSEEEMLSRISRRSRDTSRTPMAWDDSKNAGFSNHTPWIKINERYREINVKEQLMRSDSCLNYHKRLFEIRKKMPVIVDGTFELIDPLNSKVFAYIRKDSNQSILILCNFSNEEVTFNINLNGNKKIILSNDDNSTFLKDKKLSPFEALVIELR
ncbi:MAG: glycoside hydrolase family 13 protein [Acholeplasmataceae bacterium]|jgi:oligo-1,6-glucosidase